MTKPFQQETDTLIVLEIAHVHGHWARSIHSDLEKALGTMPVSRVRLVGGEQRGVFDPAYGLVRRVPVGYVLERCTHGQDAQAPSYRNRLAPAKRSKRELEAGIGVDQLLGEG
jgi:hypothetical protein